MENTNVTATPAGTEQSQGQGQNQGGGNGGEQTQSLTAETAFLVAQYNKEDKFLTKEEAITFAQKGMNYDKILERSESSRKELEAVKKAMEPVNRFLKESGFEDFDAYTKDVGIKKIMSDRKLDKEAAELVYEGQRAKAIAAEKAQQDKDLTLFIETFPDVKPDEIPAEVWQAQTKKGIPLVAAYSQWKMAQLQAGQQATEKNNQNKEASTGGTGGTGGGTGPDSYYTMAQIKGMDRNEIMANYDRVQKSIKYHSK